MTITGKRRRKRCGVVLGAIATVLTTTSAPALNDQNPNSNAMSNPLGNASERLQKRKETTIAQVHRVLGSFMSAQGVFREYVLIDAGLEDDEIVEIARSLHALEPGTWYYLMDGDIEFDKMLAALPETENGDYANWPSDYVEEHYIGRLMQELRPDDDGDTIRVWLFEGGPSREQLVVDL